VLASLATTPVTSLRVAIPCRFRQERGATGYHISISALTQIIGKTEMKPGLVRRSLTPATTAMVRH